MLKFSKMHGIGNDYIYVDCMERPLADPAGLVVRLSDRRFGIGGDGLILILPSDVADFRMQMFNADGSEGMMCGNGIRCVGKYVYDHGLTDQRLLSVETKSGVKRLELFIEDGKVAQVEVSMGKAILKPSDIPMRSELERFVALPIEACGKTWTGTAVSMGNPHLVIFGGDPDELDLGAIGPAFERHPLFPDRVNTEFVQVLDDGTLKMRVWERGSGETLACGTGACAVTVAAVLNGYRPADTPVTVRLRGGDLVVTYAGGGDVTMRGAATHVFDGEIDV